MILLLEYSFISILQGCRTWLRKHSKYSSIRNFLLTLSLWSPGDSFSWVWLKVQSSIPRINTIDNRRMIDLAFPLMENGENEIHSVDCFRGKLPKLAESDIISWRDGKTRCGSIEWVLLVFYRIIWQISLTSLEIMNFTIYSPSAGKLKTTLYTYFIKGWFV